MTNILLCGPNSPLGLVALSINTANKPYRICATVDISDDSEEIHVKNSKIPNYFSFNNIKQPFDVIVNACQVCHPGETETILKFAKQSKKPAFFAYDTYSTEDDALINEYSRYIPIYKARNMSVSVFMFIQECSDFAQVWDGDIEIIETHSKYNNQIPSALSIQVAEAMIKARGYGEVVVGRMSPDDARRHGDICISSLRGGSVASEHEVRFYNGDCEYHTCMREYGHIGVVTGAFRIAEFVASRTAPGIYTIVDYINGKRKLAMSRAAQAQAQAKTQPKKP